MAANIKFKRTSTSTLPTGLTFAEPAFVLGSSGTTTANQLYIGDNSGGRVWVGAKIENTVTNWTGTEANTLLATQQAIDARITSRITSSGGFTFQGSAGTAQTITPGDTVTFAGSTGISTIGGATDTITFVNTGVLSVNGNTGTVSNIAVTNAAQSFSGLQQFTTGICAAGFTFTGTTMYFNGYGALYSPPVGTQTPTDAYISMVGAEGDTVPVGGGITLSAYNVNFNATKINLGSASLNGTVVTSIIVQGESAPGATGTVIITPGSNIGVSRSSKSITITNNGVRSFNGLTGAVTGLSQVLAGSGITLSPAGGTGTQTITNTGVLSFNGSAGTVTGVGSFNGFTGTVTGVGSFNGLTGTVTGVSSLSLTAGSGITFTTSGITGSIAVTLTNAGVTGIQPGTGISVTSNTGNPTINNTGVLSFNGSTGTITGVASFNGSTGIVVGVSGLTGTANQITVSGTTGSITLSLPSAITAPGSLTVTGDLVVNGTTTTVNSTTVQIQDPIIAIGGYTGGTPPTVGDVKDRGIAFQWYSGGGATGFFGHDTSANAFTYIASGATLASEVVSGTPGKAIFGTVDIYSATGNATLSYSGSAATFTLPNHASGTLLAPSSLGTANYILKSNGSAAQPSWQDPTAAGFTAYIATNVSGGAAGSLHIQTAANTTGMLSLGTSNFILTAGSTGPQWSNPNAAGFTAYASQFATNIVTTEAASTTYYLAMATGAAAGGTAIYVDTTATALTYAPATGTLTCTAVDALIDGGAY